MARVEIYESCNDTVAHLGGVRRAVGHAAHKGAAIAKGVLLAHRHSGDSQITVTRGELDYWVNLDDTRGQRAAAAIEFGNYKGGGGIDALGKAFGLTGGVNPKGSFRAF